MGRLEKTETLINKAVPNWSSVKLIPRGVPTYLDQLLRGQVRFARKTGATLGVLNPDNSVKLSQDALDNTRELRVKKFLDWYEINALLSIGPKLETVQIYDLDLENKRIVLTEDLRATHPANEIIELLATPLYINSNHAKGVTSINVRSRYSLVNGDIILLIKGDSLESQVEIEVDQAQFGGVGGDPDYPNIYQLDLKAPTIKALSENEMIYLRAYPAYVSKTILLQDNLSFTSMPPHLLDYLSGKLREGTAPREVFSIRLSDKFNNILFGTGNTYEKVSKNYPVIDRNIPSDSMVFWDLIDGTFQLSPQGSITICDERGLFNAKMDLVPNFQNEDITWKIPVKVETETTIRLRFAPNDWQEFVLDQNGVIPFVFHASDLPANQIELVVKTKEPRATVVFGDWVVEGDIANFVEYTLVVQISGEASWQSTGLIVKPYFLSSSYVKGRYDNEEHFDSARMRL